ncbi:MAG: hypothetical protein IT443_01795 [Phycisphaeraceae bacterium]|nr:hypothetical protein [Phycisphaeraceae bacterium]
MNFCTDRDLLVFEPTVFGDVPLAGQERLRTNDGVVQGTTLESAAGDFAAAGVAAGSVVLIGGEPCEVVERVDEHQLTITRPRARGAGELMAPASGVSLEVVGRTFEPQITRAHQAMLLAMGMDAESLALEGDQSRVLSTEAMVELEALASLELIYRAGVALTGDNAGLAKKAEEYRRRFGRSWEQAVVMIDRDGDGLADRARHLGVQRLRRV